MSIYNPHLLPREALIERFVVRGALLDELVEDLRRGGNHHLIIGDRGAGKTMLLLRIAAEIERDKKLVALRFPEEQYNVGTPADFWMNTVDALVDALEQHGEAKRAKDLEARAAELESLDAAEQAASAIALLEDEARRSRRSIVLLVDNFDLILERLEDSHWSLRDTLSADNGLVLIGASSKLMDDVVAYKSPFYDFFKLHQLTPLPEVEARELVLALARQAKTPHVEELLAGDPGRFKALYILTGGTPRTLALLHTVLAQDPLAHGIGDDLDRLLDAVTPYYKARFDDLPAQSQIVVDAVALHWHPITAADVANHTKLEVNVASAQLNRLTKSGLLSKVTLSGATKLGFQVTERFFNIWYLMRASRRLRRRLTWFVEFLRSFYGDAELERRAQELLAKHRVGGDPAKLLAFASALPDELLRRRLELRALTEFVAHERSSRPLHDVLELDGEDAHFAPTVDRLRTLRDLTARILEDKNFAGVDRQQLAEAFLGNPWVSLAEKTHFLTALKAGWQNGGLEYAKALMRSHEQMVRIAGEGLIRAIFVGEVAAFPDVTTAHEFDLMLQLSNNRGFVAIGFLRPQGRTPKEILERIRDVSPTGGDIILACAGFISQQDWAEARRLAEFTLDRPRGTVTMVHFCNDLLLSGHKAELLELLQPEWALPFREAVVALDDSFHLLKLAPELRAVVSDIVARLGIDRSAR